MAEEEDRELSYKLAMLNHAREIYLQHLKERWVLIRWQMLVYGAIFGSLVAVSDKYVPGFIIAGILLAGSVCFFGSKL